MCSASVTSGWGSSLFSSTSEEASLLLLFLLIPLSEMAEVDERERERGGRPDLTSSLEVFTWRRTLRGLESREGGRALFIAEAALMDDIVCMEYRFGMPGRWGCFFLCVCIM